MIKLRITLLLNIVLIIVIIFCYFINKTYISKFNGNETEIKGYIRKINIDGDKLSMIIKSSEKIVINYYFKTEEEKNSFDLELNDYIKVIGSMRVPTNNTLFNMFNYKNYLYTKRIFYVFNSNKIELIKKNNDILFNIKNSIISRVNSINKSKDYINTFVLGNKSYIDKEDYDNYINLGIVHLLSLSGMHISLIISLLKKAKLNKYIVILFLLFYLFIIEFQVSVFRSFVMFLLSIFNKKFNLDKLSLLKISSIILLLIEPLYLYNIGFIYTYVITFFIYYFNDCLSNKNYFIKSLKLGIITFIASLPIVINTNFSINILSIIMNIIFIPIVSFIIFPLSILTFIFPFLDNVLFFITSIFNNIVSLCNNISFLTFSFSKLPIFLIVLYYIILLNYKTRNLILILITLFYFYNYYVFNPIIYFIDVGQGDSTLIRINNKNILIDTGGKTTYEKEKWQQRRNEYSLIKNSISFFKSIGVKKIDYLILTHGDYDHMGETLNLVSSFKVDNVIFNCGEINDLEKELINKIDNYNTCIKELNIDNNKFMFLQTREYDNENDNSNVIYTELNNYRFLFMGDAGIGKEKDILKKYDISDIDVLKVGHHGSKTSSSKSFINIIKPKYSVISVGKNNKYGHPNREVLNNLKESKIYRTDQDGSIMFKIKNDKLKIETCSQ
ncbi:MAG: DNA internalization-related competence protein ComEC/Rec2 [Bacilli bacterium]|nr:DNA internalization-related competence protein ComEC/Rec2 [Bacilli bacterium]